MKLRSSRIPWNHFGFVTLSTKKHSFTMAMNENQVELFQFKSTTNNEGDFGLRR